MRASTKLLVCGWVLAATAAFAQAPESAAPAPGSAAEPTFNWQPGPMRASLGTVAEIDVPAGYVFLDGSETRRLLEALENPTNGDEIGALAPADSDWLVTFEFEEVGYVPDDEKDELDADDMLDSIKQGNEAANEMRRQRGWKTIDVTGWHTPPNYNPTTNNLEWAIRGRSGTDEVLNFNTRLLGRRGVVSAVLMASPQQLEGVLPKYRELLAKFDYKAGQKYGEFVKGDRVAEYGLAALVTGGAVAAAAKTGLLAKLVAMLGKAWKLVAVGIAGIGVSIKRLFTRRNS
jgi:uncharacterized membrane-anchored protein